MINSGWQKLEKYYSKTDESPVYTAAIILNPMQKEAYINRFWRPLWVDRAKAAVKKLWQE
jgi:hypothetical protein